MYWWVALIWLGIVGVSGFLMVSTWRFWSGKEINFSHSHPFQVLLPMAIALFLIVKFSGGALFTLALVYMFSGIWARAVYSWQRRRRSKPLQEAQAQGEIEANLAEKLRQERNR